MLKKILKFGSIFLQIWVICFTVQMLVLSFFVGILGDNPSGGSLINYSRMIVNPYYSLFPAIIIFAFYKNRIEYYIDSKIVNLSEWFRGVFLVLLPIFFIQQIFSVGQSILGCDLYSFVSSNKIFNQIFFFFIIFVLAVGVLYEIYEFFINRGKILFIEIVPSFRFMLVLTIFFGLLIVIPSLGDMSSGPCATIPSIPVAN